MHKVVNRPVIDLRRLPIESTYSALMDENQETQLLYGELVEIFEEQGDWAYIKAHEQLKCMSDGSWGGYPGWVKKDTLYSLEEPFSNNLIVKSNWSTIEAEKSFDVSIGTRLNGTEELGDHWVIKLTDGEKGRVSKKDVWLLSHKADEVPQSIINAGRNMIGFPYYWGGRSAYRSEWNHFKTSIDCSGFVNILYRIHGIDLPRDAHDQFLKARACEYENLVPGDLIFTAPVNKPNRMTHVILHSSPGYLLEATAASMNVREIPVKDRFSCSLSGVKAGSVVGGCVVHFGKVR
jgi:hypothetical protein